MRSLGAPSVRFRIYKVQGFDGLRVLVRLMVLGSAPRKTVSGSGGGRPSSSGLLAALGATKALASNMISKKIMTGMCFLGRLSITVSIQTIAMVSMIVIILVFTQNLYVGYCYEHRYAALIAVCIMSSVVAIAMVLWMYVCISTQTHTQNTCWTVATRQLLRMTPATAMLWAMEVAPCPWTPARSRSSIVAASRLTPRSSSPCSSPHHRN